MSPMNNRLMRPQASRSKGVPATISGLALWLDASDVSSLGPTSAGPGTVTENGVVKYWGDKSGNGRHATNAGADSVSPTYKATDGNGRPAVSFDGGDHIEGAWPLTLTEQTVFAVTRIATGGGNGGRIFSQSDANADFSTSGHYIPLLRNTSSNDISSYAGSGFRAIVIMPLVAGETVLAVVMSQHTGSEIQNRVNNGTAATYSHALNKTFTRYRIGTDFAGTGVLAGPICEIICYSRSLTDAERNTIAQYLGQKFNITVS